MNEILLENEILLLSKKCIKRKNNVNNVMERIYQEEFILC